MYEIRLLDDAQSDLAQLDPPIARRIARKLEWLEENAEYIKPSGLRRGLAGLSRLREGDYRILFEIIHSEKIVIVHGVGHRSRVYRK